MRTQIRSARLSDLKSIIQIEQAAFSQSLYDLLSTRQWRYLLTQAKADILVAEQQNQVLGVCVVLYRKRSRYGRIYSIAVDPVVQKQAIGRQLITHCLQMITDKGLVGVLCEVRQDQQQLIRFYQSLGFQAFKTLESYYPDGMSGLKLRKIFTA